HFEDCSEKAAVRLDSSDPRFRVEADGSVYTQRDVFTLNTPITFTVTAHSADDTHTWETSVHLQLEFSFFKCFSLL
ncbi:cadherin-4-like isoform X1, partial [Tachysurus ichikawai]